MGGVQARAPRAAAHPGVITTLWKVIVGMVTEFKCGEALSLYHSLDDLDVRALAEQTPDELVGRPGPMVLDEVQRVPDLLLTVKRAVDVRRRPGRYILTGSANLLLMKAVSESLAGRATYLSLWPMTRRERSGHGRAGVCNSRSPQCVAG